MNILAATVPLGDSDERSLLIRFELLLERERRDSCAQSAGEQLCAKARVAVALRRKIPQAERPDGHGHRDPQKKDDRRCERQEWPDGAPGDAAIAIHARN